MLYLIDANVIITAKDSYYGMTQVPEFWAWLVHQGTEGRVKIPEEIWDEVSSGPDETDPFHIWRKDRAVREALLLTEDVPQDLMQRVLDEGYGANLTDNELMEIGKDPFLVAYAMLGDERCVVTTEVSAPAKRRANRKVPDVCRNFGITPYNTFDMTRLLEFSTAWGS